MDFEQNKQRLIANAERIQALVQDVTAVQAVWRPDGDSWSILEVINHLYDEEREDFRVRLGIILHQPHEPWPPIDPGGWVTARAYNERELAASLANFLAERQKSLAWLDTLENPDWAASVPAPWGEPFLAGDMFAAWVAHDLLHIRQLVELHWAYTGQQLRPYSPQYAGDW